MENIGESEITKALQGIEAQLKRIADAIDEERKKERHEQGEGAPAVDRNPPVRN
jgi:hypothetical protein